MTTNEDAELLRAIMGTGQGGSRATVTVRQDSLIAIAVGVFCAGAVAVACTVCVASVIVVGVMRDADMRDMAQIRARLISLEQYRDQHARRLNEIETKGVGRNE